MKIPRVRKPMRRVLALPRGAVVVTLHPNGQLSFHALGKQRRFKVSLEQLLSNALPPTPGGRQLELEERPSS